MRRVLIAIALAALAGGGAAWFAGARGLAGQVWASGAFVVIAELAISIAVDLLAGKLGVDAVALVSMSGALILGEALTAIVIAVMYAGGTALEEFAVSRAERDLKALINRAPRIAHRERSGQVIDVPVGEVAVGDRLLVRGARSCRLTGSWLSRMRSSMKPR